MNKSKRFMKLVQQCGNISWKVHKLAWKLHELEFALLKSSYKRNNEEKMELNLFFVPDSVT